MISFLSSIFKRRKTSFNQEGIIFTHAFTIAGREYMTVDSIYNLPYQRGMGAVMIYEEMKMKCDYEYLRAYAMGVNNLLTSKSIGSREIMQVIKLNDQLTERLNLAIDPDLVYKLASVVFFDKSESPFDYDPGYAKKKIALWKKYKSTEDFFLQEPLQKLIPYLRSPEITTETYLETVAMLNKIHWGEVLSLLSQKQKERLSVNKDSYAGEILQNSANFTS